MKTINSSDIIYVTAMQCGTTLVNMRLSGASSITDVTRMIQGRIGSQRGMVSVNLRNGSQGWMHRYSMMLRA